MCEIIMLVILCRSIGNVVAAKGRQKIGYQLMLVGLWIGGEILGVIAGIAVIGATGGGKNDAVFAYIGALGGALLGAMTAFIIASSLPPIHRDDDYYYRGGYERGGYDRGGYGGYEGDYRRPEERRPPRGADDPYGDRPASPPEDDRFTR